MKPVFRLFTQDQIYMILETETKLHQDYDLVDLYKLLFQAHLGPHHMSPDRDAIIHNIERETVASKQLYLPALQDIGAQEGFYRVGLNSLDLFKVEKPVEMLADLILASRFEKALPHDIWKRIWRKSYSLVRLFINAPVSEWKAVQAMLDQDHLPSHSERYKNAYHPHYRLVHYSLLSPYLEESICLEL
ncbi:MAG: hypothetical protein Q8M98_10870 [Candidatus Cloacimonadaceae bacterium]|nr:hypothetical protein [Candidatus Cloacimonadaceae bacterium]MDP3115257.1 hypothetical protein [Candidatus Cloacimonadaceae bacterium]